MRSRLGIAATAAALGLAAIGVASVRATAAPDLPTVGADRLLESTLRALAQPFTVSGDVSTSVDLGIPQIPSSLGGGALGPVALPIGDQRFKVWHSPEGVRVAHLLDVGEQDLVANAREGWFWDSASMTAFPLPIAPAGTMVLPGAAPSDMATPDLLSIARRAISALAPYADVTVPATTLVADRPAYELVLTPSSTLTLIGRIEVSIDAGTRLPLRLRVFPRGSETAAIDGGFTSVSFDAIDPSMFAFTPPPGATVRPATDLFGGPRQAPADGAPPAPAEHRVFGSGFDVRFAYRLSSPLPQDVSTLLPYAGPLLSAIAVERDGRTWVLAGPVPVATLERDAATLP